MHNLDKNYDPSNNSQLIEQITGKKLDIKVAIENSLLLFEQCRSNDPASQPTNPAIKTVPFFKWFLQGIFRLLAKPTQRLELTTTFVDQIGNVFPAWKPKLDAEYTKLLKNIQREVNLTDFGAVGDGRTDNTAAFKKAIGNGRVKVIVPPGVYITKGIRLPSWTSLVGAGKGITTIKLHDRASKGTRLVTNANHWSGNHHLSVQGLTLDWNVERLGDVEKTSTWGNHSSCLTYAHVTFGWVKNVEAINPGLHCFDISSPLYNYAGDGYRSKGGSQYIWLDQLTGYGFGDDGITTHHSDDIFISNSHMCDPSGRAHRKGFSNSNGIEVDDGSQNVLLVNNSTARCFGGIEIKAHENSSAAANVQIVGHISLNDNRAYNFRHIGHHKSTDNESKSAYNIIATNLVAVEPIFTHLYQNSTPRGLVVSAYKNVVIHHFTLIGDPLYDYKSNPVMAIQYRARNVILRNISIKNFNLAGSGVKVFGGENKADSIQISNLQVDDSLSKEIEIGEGIHQIQIEKMKEVQTQT
jgi:hypothetical protein